MPLPGKKVRLTAHAGALIAPWPTLGPALKTLVLSNCSIGAAQPDGAVPDDNIDMEDWPSIFASVSSLDLSNNSFGTLPRGVGAI